MPSVERFDDARQYATFAGVTPTVFESGSSVRRKAHISKKGIPSVRKVLYMAAISVKNRNKDFADFVEKLQKRGKAPKVIICAIMRKLLHIFFGMLSSGAKFNANLAFSAKEQ
jgi:transposase